LGRLDHVSLVERRGRSAHQVVADRPARGLELALSDQGGDLARGADEPTEREQAAQREGFEHEPGGAEPRGEPRHQCSGHTGEAGDRDGERRATDQEPGRRAAAQPAATGRQQPADPGDGMEAVGRISEREVDRQRQGQRERPREGKAQDFGNGSPTSLAMAGTSSARATASASRS
jgi:hypothetical protein